MPTLTAKMFDYIQKHPNCKRRAVMLNARFATMGKGGYAKRRAVLNNLVNLGLINPRFYAASEN